MKKIYAFLFCLITCFGFSQAPKLINYQGVIRKANGTPFTSPVKIRFEIYPSASGGSPAFTEIQTTNTNTLGLFSTRIGETVPLNLNWGTGSWYLEVSVDTANTNNFVSLGRQQMVSVPYALYAESAGSAPAPQVSYSNSVLYVGTNSVSIPAPPGLNAGNGVSITSGTITNTAPDQTVTISGTGNAQVNSAYPDFTVNVNPQTLSINSNSITLSNGGGTVVLPSTSSTPNTSLTSTGIATVTTSGTNTFNINVPPTNITGVGAANVSGTFPNYTISTTPPPTTSISGMGVASVNPLSGNGFTVNVPPPALNLAGNILTVTQGTSSSNVTLPVSPTPTINGAGIASVNPLSGNNFTVNVPGPVLGLAGNALSITQGTAGNTVLLPPAPTITGAGIATVTPSGNNFTVNVAQPNFLGVGGTTVGGTYPNLTIGSPSYALSFPTSSTALLTNGISTSTATIPQPVFTGTNGISVSGTGPTFTIGLNNNSPASGWSTLGNSNTNSTNFLGTTDNMPLRFRTNNSQVGQFTSWGAFAVGNGGPTSTLSVFGNFAVGSTFGSGGPAPINSAIIEGSVGVGTSVPGTRLDIWGSSNVTSLFGNPSSPETAIRVRNNDLTNGNISSLVFGATSTGSSFYESAKIVAVNSNHTVGTQAGELVFMVRSPANINEAMRISSSGFVGINNASPSQQLDILGSIKMKDGNEGAGKFLISDATGVASWQSRNTVVNAISPPGCQNLSFVGTAPTLLATLGSFNKLNSGSFIELNLQTFIFVSNFNASTTGVVYELRIDGNPGIGNSGKAIYLKNNGGTFNIQTAEQENIQAIFASLPAGNHLVQLYVYSVNGSASDAYYDPGCYNTTSLIVKEFW